MLLDIFNDSTTRFARVIQLRNKFIFWCYEHIGSRVK